MCMNEVKRHLFRAHYSAVYCSYIWSSFSVMSLRKHMVGHNDIFRRLLGEPRWNRATAMLARSYLDNLTVLLRKLSYGFNLRLQNSDNSSLKPVYELHSFVMSDLNARWRNSFEIRRLLYSFSICVSYMLEYKLSMICVADRYKDLFVYSFVLNNISPHSC